MFPKERKTNIKLDKLVAEKFPVVAEFPRCHQVLSRPQIVSSVILFTLCSQLVQAFTFG